jgi:hypothetical protein
MYLQREKWVHPCHQHRLAVKNVKDEGEANRLLVGYETGLSQSAVWCTLHEK